MVSPAPAARRGPEADLRASVRTVLDAYRDVDPADGYDTGMWARLAHLPGLAVPTECGGAGLGLTALGAALEETGRALAPVPLLPAVVATWALGHVQDPSGNEVVLHELTGGARRAAVVLEAFEDGNPGVSSTAGRLSGIATRALDVGDADWLVVEADTCSGSALYLVDPHAEGVERRFRETPDRTSRLADVRFDGAPGEWFAGPETVSRVRAVAAIALACRQLGGATATLDLVLAYARGWATFRRQGASFARMRQHCADLYLLIDAARAATTAATAAADAGAADLTTLAAIAKIRASAAYLRGASLGVQLFVGTELPSEHAVHLHVRRSRTDEYLFGTPDAHRAAIADLLELT